MDRGDARGLQEADLPGIEGFDLWFTEIETRNLYGSFAFDSGYTRWVPAFTTTLFITELNSDAGCDE